MEETILISMIFIFIYIFLFINRNKLVYVESNSGTKFLLHKDNNQFNKEKANLLSNIVQNIFLLKNHLKKNINNLSEYKDYIEQLNENLDENTTVIYETDPESDLTSYSVNKGEEISFCLRSKKTGKLHNLNLLMYVAIHEISHIACPEIGHGELFRKIFAMFLDEAIKIGIYKKVNYAESPVEYCGMVLSSSII